VSTQTQDLGDDEQYGRSVRERREQRRWNQSQLAAYAGLSREIVRKMEAGKHIRQTTRDRIERAFADNGAATPRRVDEIDQRVTRLEDEMKRLRDEIRRASPTVDAGLARKLATIRNAAEHRFPAPPIDDMLAEIEAGYHGETAGS
jgi:transcriptional regulator with XRE-family HTH domain